MVRVTELKLVALPDKVTLINAGLYKSVTEYIELVKAANEAVDYINDVVLKYKKQIDYKAAKQY